MKIYEIGTGYTPIPAEIGAATEIVVEELTKAFLKQGADVEIIDIAADSRKENDLPIREVKIPKCFTETDVKLGLMHKLKRVVYSIALSAELKKILRETDEKVVLHFHNQYNLFFFLKLAGKDIRSRARIAYTVHSYIWASEWKIIENTVRKRYFQEIFCVQNADDVLVLNEKTAEHFVRHLGVSSDRIRRIDNGVNTDVYRILPDEEVNAFKKSVGLDGKKVIFQVGSVCDRKNQLGVVELLKEYLQRNPDVVYAYAGGIIDPEYQSKIEGFSLANGIHSQVLYLGELRPGAQLNGYYNVAEFTVFPSKLESFGLVIIESLSAGVPVLMANEPLFAVENGYGVYGSATDFIQLTEFYLNEHCPEQQARYEVIQHYSWDKVARDHLEKWKTVGEKLHG